MIDHALSRKLQPTMPTTHLLNAYLQFLLIKTLALQRVHEISSEWLESLQFVGAVVGFQCHAIQNGSK